MVDQAECMGKANLGDPTSDIGISFTQKESQSTQPKYLGPR